MVTKSGFNELLFGSRDLLFGISERAKIPFFFLNDPPPPETYPLPLPDALPFYCSGELAPRPGQHSRRSRVRPRAVPESPERHPRPPRVHGVLLRLGHPVRAPAPVRRRREPQQIGRAHV